MRASKHIVGLDLGQMGDFSALADLCFTPDVRPVYHVPTLHRWQLGTSYTDIAKDLAAFLKQPGMAEAELVIDQTGVGLAVAELIHRELTDAGIKKPFVGITITGGAAVNRISLRQWNVAKRQLVSAISAVVHSGRILVAKDQPEAAALIREMSTFKSKININTGNESFEAHRERDHDDLVLAVAIACWAAERPRARAGSFVAK